MGLLDIIDKGFDYYREPEGEDPVGKILGLAQYGFWTGSFLGLYDAFMWSHCANAPQFLNTYAYWVAPLTGMCVTFSTVTYSLCRFRNKDDKWNYVAGALSAGAVSHAWLKHVRRSAWVTSLAVMYAVLKKQNIEDGRSRNVIMLDPDEELHRKWYFPWRNLPHRNYSSKPWYPHDKEDYYVNHY